MSEDLSGGCQCGRIRYTVTVDDREAYLCHCDMCKRATGGVAAALKNVARGSLRWSIEPDRYRSSPFARRGFCAACGTPLTYEGDDDATLDLTLGSFDLPELLRPTSHVGVEGRLAAWIDTRNLPAERTDRNPRIVAAWENSGGKLPE